MSNSHAVMVRKKEPPPMMACVMIRDAFTCLFHFNRPIPATSQSRNSPASYRHKKAVPAQKLAPTSEIIENRLKYSRNIKMLNARESNISDSRNREVLSWTNSGWTAIMAPAKRQKIFLCFRHLQISNTTGTSQVPVTTFSNLP
ncbi:hypothetical protein SDC9_200949 [bioreactor metagenome]|uniref:Uncharacterized protein n=1 Tax=bioreactor metagenome TaxID=1076179 RepID=A0A645IPK9_9ZZZZ